MKIYPYFVTEHGKFMPREVFSVILNLFEKNGWEPQDLGMGSAYNMPIYLLGEIEDHYGEAIVIAVDMGEQIPKVMAFIEESEIKALTEALEAAGEDEDSWDICCAVHRKLRG